MPRLGALAVLSMFCAPASYAQPPAEMVGQAQVACVPADWHADLVAQCPGLPSQHSAEPESLPKLRPHGFDHVVAAPAREDERGEGFYVFGETRNNHAGPYLAYAPIAALDETRQWEIFTGRGLSGSVNWVSAHRWQNHLDESGNWSPGAKATVFAPDEAAGLCGNYQAEWNGGLRRWLMFYNCGGDGRVRVAAKAWGPWSDPVVVFGSGGEFSAPKFIVSENVAADGAQGFRDTRIFWLVIGGKAARTSVLSVVLRQEGAE